MGIETALAIGSFALGAVGTIQTRRAQKKQERAQRAAIDEQRAAREAQQRQQRLRQQRERREFIRQSRIKRAQIVSAGAAQGATESSGVAGGLGSLQTRTAAGLGFLNASESLANEANQRTLNAEQFLGQANIFGTQAATSSSVANLGATIFSNRRDIAGAIREVRNDFNV